MRALEAVEARLSLRVDLAAVERLALRLVAEDLVGRVEFGELHRRLGIVLVGVGMQLLGQLAVGLFDVVLARRPRHPQNLVGVAHSLQLPILQSNPGVNVVPRWPLCNSAAPWAADGRSARLRSGSADGSP